MQTRLSSCESDWVCPMLFLDIFAAPSKHSASIHYPFRQEGPQPHARRTLPSGSIWGEGGGLISAVKSAALQSCCVVVQA